MVTTTDVVDGRASFYCVDYIVNGRPQHTHVIAANDEDAPVAAMRHLGRVSRAFHTTPTISMVAVDPAAHDAP